jgi:glucose-6-phosphate isomerase
MTERSEVTIKLTDLTPFTTMLDLDSGTLTPTRGAVARRTLAELRGLYAAGDDVADEPDRLVYQVFPVEVPATNSNISCSTTRLEPGDVGGEYFMTKGHFHHVRDRGEFYLGIAGEGRLLLATADGRWTVEPLRRGTMNYIPGGWAHRSVNVGGEPLVFLAAYIADAGYDYATIERTGFPVCVMRGAEGPVTVENPRYGGA